jgi:hypothetical protein
VVTSTTVGVQGLLGSSGGVLSFFLQDDTATTINKEIANSENSLKSVFIVMV